MLVQLRDRLTRLDKVLHPFSRRTLVWLSRQYPRAYLGATLTAAFCGYLVLFAFPVLALGTALALLESIPAVFSGRQWLTVAVQLPVMLSAGLVSHAVFRMRFRPPSGLELTAEQFPRLFELLQELRREYDGTRIDRVVLRDRFDVRIVKTPRNGFPLYTTRTLVIGLPVLLTLSPLDVHVLLARRVGLLGGQHSPVSSWLYSLRDMWAHYLPDCGRGAHWAVRLLCGFFRWYVPFYRTVSLPLVRSSELDADLYALQTMNDADTARAITAQVITETFLARRFWPGIARTVGKSVRPEALPHAQMAKLFAGGLAEDQLRPTLGQIEKQVSDPGSALPSLAERLDNIGHQTPSLPEPLSITAARFYLGGALSYCIEVVDRRTVQKLRGEVKHTRRVTSGRGFRKSH
ncbi:MAG: hypothetical protein PVI91_00095 [Gammaproteobacteria bacterium]